MKLTVASAKTSRKACEKLGSVSSIPVSNVNWSEKSVVLFWVRSETDEVVRTSILIWMCGCWRYPNGAWRPIVELRDQVTAQLGYWSDRIRDSTISGWSGTVTANGPWGVHLRKEVSDFYVSHVFLNQEPNWQIRRKIDNVLGMAEAYRKGTRGYECEFATAGRQSVETDH
jgi:hypothetical protein